MPLKIYQPDGGYNQNRLLALAVSGVLLSLIGGAAYGYLAFEFRVTPIGIVVWVAAGVGLGKLLDKALRWVHNRNTGMLYGLAGLCTLVWFYAAWAVFQTRFIQRYGGDPPHTVVDPREIAEYILAYIFGINNLTQWHAGGPHQFHLLQAIIAIGEPLGLFGLWLYQARQHLAIPYYPAAQDWGQMDSPWPGYWSHDTLFLTKGMVLADETFNWFDGLRPSHQHENAISFSIYQYADQDACYLTVFLTKMGTRKHKTRMTDEPLVTNICLDRKTLAALDDLFPYETGDDDSTQGEAAEAGDSSDEGTANSSQSGPTAPQPTKDLGAEWDK